VQRTKTDLRRKRRLQAGSLRSDERRREKMKKDWTSFTQRITIDATIRSIYDAWVKPANLESWFLSSAVFTTPDKLQREHEGRIKAGDTYRWTWHGYPENIIETGSVLEANGHNHLRFTFTDECIVNVAINVEDGEKVVELTQDQIPPDEKLRIYLDCSKGWMFYLVNLKSMLEGGIDLRNKNKNISNVVNA